MRFVILGSGPAGYAAATAASSLGADVTLVEDHGLGGNCTLTDAIPSKSLIHTSSVLATVESARSTGLDVENGHPTIDLLRAVAHARWVATHQSRGIRDRLESTEAKVVTGRGTITGEDTVAVQTPYGERELRFDHLLIATGADPWSPPFARVDGERVFTPRDVLSLRALPEHLIVVGGGPTGCEYAEFFLSCGVRVTLLSARDQILPAEDSDIAEVVQEAFLSRGMELQMNARVDAVETTETGVLVTTEDGRSFEGSHAAVCMGMRPNTADIGLEVLDLDLDARGAIVVDEHWQSSVPGVYAAGDVSGGMMLASTAAMQGRHAALHALGSASEPLVLGHVPWTVFTRPEIATVGLTEGRALEHRVPVDVTKHYLRANPRAVIADATDGVIKLVTDPESGTIVGGSVVGYRASELITAVALAVGCRLSVEALASTGTVTPSMSESLQRAAEKAITNRLQHGSRSDRPETAATVVRPAPVSGS
jgi:pyruvate/2-oxoglutarate dehydrogenase complex dihydrolipoamide dehydrogenase (E3) component